MARASDSQQGYPLSPRQLTKLAWFYEEPRGICVVQQPNVATNGLMVTIPWAKLERAVANHRKLKRGK